MRRHPESAGVAWGVAVRCRGAVDSSGRRVAGRQCRGSRGWADSHPRGAVISRPGAAAFSFSGGHPCGRSFWRLSLWRRTSRRHRGAPAWQRLLGESRRRPQHPDAAARDAGHLRALDPLPRLEVSGTGHARNLGHRSARQDHGSDEATVGFGGLLESVLYVCFGHFRHLRNGQYPSDWVLSRGGRA